MYESIIATGCGGDMLLKCILVNFAGANQTDVSKHAVSHADSALLFKPPFLLLVSATQSCSFGSEISAPDNPALRIGGVFLDVTVVMNDVKSVLC